MKKKTLVCLLLAVSLILAIACLFPLTCREHDYSEEVPVCKTGEGYLFRKHCTKCEKQVDVLYDAVLTFVDDDAKADALRHWEAIIDATGIRMTSAVISSRVTETTEYKGYWTYAGWDMIERLMDKGVDFVCHTHNHKNLTKLTEEELHADFQAAREILAPRGVNTDLLVYPNNAYNDLVLSVVKEYFSAAVACGGKLNCEPFEGMYTLRRVNINSSHDRKDIDFGDGKVVACDGILPLDSMKTHLQEAVNQDAWLIFMCHAYDSPGGKYYFGDREVQRIIDFCTYVQELGNVKIITLTEGVALITGEAE